MVFLIVLNVFIRRSKVREMDRDGVGNYFGIYFEDNRFFNFFFYRGKSVFFILEVIY